MDSTERDPALLFVTLKAAVWKGGRLLLQYETPTQGSPGWDLPGGRLDRGESVEEGLHRELREELGVGVRRCSPLPVKVWTAINRCGHGVVALLYRVELDSQDFDHSGAADVQRAAYLSLDEFADTPRHPHFEAIREVLAGGPGAPQG